MRNYYVLTQNAIEQGGGVSLRLVRIKERAKVMLFTQESRFKRRSYNTHVTQVIVFERKISQITIVYQSNTAALYLYKTLKDDDVMISTYKMFIPWYVSLLLLHCEHRLYRNTTYAEVNICTVYASKCLGTRTDVTGAHQNLILYFDSCFTTCICGDAYRQHKNVT